MNNISDEADQLYLIFFLLGFHCFHNLFYLSYYFRNLLILVYYDPKLFMDYFACQMASILSDFFQNLEKEL